MKKHPLIKIFCSLCLFGGASTCIGTTYSWNIPSSGSWTNSSNWTPVGYPNNAADQADFVIGSTSSISVSVPIPISLNSMLFNSTVPYLITNVGGNLILSDSGTITVSSNQPNRIDAPIMLAGNYTIQQQSTQPFTISSSISGAPSTHLKLNQGGELILSGNNAFPELIIALGTVSVSTPENLSSTTIQIGPGSFNSNLAILHTTSSFSLNQTFNLASQQGTFNTDSGTTLTLNGPLIQAANDDSCAINKQGGGSLILNGDATATGTTVYQGNLTVNATITPPPFTIPFCNIQSGGRLNGIGTINAPMTNDGIVAPGNSPGTMTVNGSYTQNPDGTLVIAYAGPTSFSQLNVIGSPGTASIAGNLNINVTQGAANTPTSGFNFLEATGGISGVFTNVTTTPSFYVPMINYGSNSVSATLVSGFPSSQVVANGNAQLAMIASQNQTYMFLITKMQQMHRTIAANQKTSLPSEEQGKTAAIFGTSHHHSSQFLAANTNVLETHPFVADPHPLDPFKELGPIADVTAKTKEKDQHLRRTVGSEDKSLPGHFYIGPLATTGKLNGVDYWVAGAQMGIDYSFSQIGVGLLAQYGYSFQKGFINEDAKVNLYASYVPKQIPQLAVNMILGYAYDWIRYSTRKGFAHDRHTAKGSPSGNQYGSLIGIEYTLDETILKKMPKGLQLSPMATLHYTQNHIDKYTEHGSGKFDMQVKGVTVKTLRLGLELITFYTRTWNNVTFSPQITLGWQREFLAKGEKLWYRSANFDGPYYFSFLPALGRNSLIAGIDLEFYFYKRFGIEASWNYEWNHLFHDSQFYLGFNYLF